LETVTKQNKCRAMVNMLYETISKLVVLFFFEQQSY